MALNQNIATLRSDLKSNFEKLLTAEENTNSIKRANAGMLSRF
jgi:hypothetical protein